MPTTLDPPARQAFRPPPLVAGLYLADLAVAALAVFGFVLAAVGLADGTFLKVGEETNLPTWYSASQLLLAGLLLLPLVARDVRRAAVGSWPLLLGPVFFFFLSLDEAAMVHERLGDWLQAETGAGAGLRTGPWMFVYVPIILVVLWATVRAYRPYWRGRPRLIGLAVAGVAILGLSAVGLEFVANFVGEGSAAQKALGFAEEVGETLGVTTLVWAVVELLRAEGVRVDTGTARS